MYSVPAASIGGIDVGVRGAGLAGRGDRDRLGEGLSPVARDGDPDLGRRTIEDRPHRVDVILVRVADDVVDRDPLLVLDMTGLPGRGVRGLLQVLPAVALDPVLAHVVGVGDVDRPVGMQRRFPPEGVERQRRLVHAALGVERDVRVGHVRPARRHRLRSGRDAVVPLHLVVVDRRAVQDAVGAEVEVVELRVLVEEELRVADQVLGARLDRDPRLGVVGVERAGPARARVRERLPRRHRIAASGRRRARHLVGERNARCPGRAASRGGGARCRKTGRQRRADDHDSLPHWIRPSCWM